MAYPLPSLDDLSKRVRTLFAEEVPGSNPAIWPNTFYVVGKILAEMGFEYHLRLDWLYRQLFASTADEEHLERHAYEIGIARRTASRAQGPATVDAATGLVIPAGVKFNRADGQSFSVRSGVTATGATATIELIADTPGLIGNTAAAVALSVADPDAVAGLGAVATVGSDGLGGGAEAETIDDLRARILHAKRYPPTGGSAENWRAWTARVAGVDPARIWVDNFDNSTRDVWITFMMDRADPIPTASDVAVVQAVINSPEIRPVTARVTTVAPTPVAVDVTIDNLAVDTQAVRDSIADELAAMFDERAEPATPTEAFVLPVAWISEAISRATGEARHTLMAPASDVTYATAGQLPRLGTITYV